MDSEEYKPNSVHAVIARIDVRLQGMESRQIENTERLRKITETHDKRITTLENWRIRIIGIATGAGFFLHQAWDKITGKS